MIDRMIFGMHHLNISQTGAGYGAGNSLSHALFELDLCGQDPGVDFWYNKMPNTYWKCAGRWGTRESGNTFFFWSCDAGGQPKKVYCADGKYRVLTMAMTHSDRDAVIGKLYGFEILVSEGIQGKATGNHIHLEVCEGHVAKKVPNIKGYYNLPNMLDCRKVFFILDGWTTVVNTHGLTFLHCKEVPVKPEEDKKPMYFYTDKASCRIREKLSFGNTNRPNGRILATMPRGAKAEITHMTNRHERDGFEWFQVRYVTETGEVINGYVQGDLQAYLVKRS